MNTLSHADTALFGKWHLGFFKEEYCPWKRGFNATAGIVNADADHYNHTIDGGYDWHSNGTIVRHRRPLVQLRFGVAIV